MLLIDWISFILLMRYGHARLQVEITLLLNCFISFSNTILYQDLLGLVLHHIHIHIELNGNMIIVICYNMIFFSSGEIF